jgi:hypothetical protein
MTNIELSFNVVLDPRLKPLAESLALDKPEWVFKHTKQSRLSLTQIDDGAVKAPENKTFTQSLAIYQNEDCLGYIGVEWRYTRKSTQRYAFFLESHRVQRNRGTRQRSAKKEIIMREAKKVLAERTLSELAETALGRIHSGFTSVIEDITAPIARLSLIKNRTEMQLYAYTMANEIDGDLTKFSQVTTQLRSPEFKQAMAEYDLGLTMRGMYSTMLCVSEHNGGFIVAEPNKAAEARLLAYDDMPEKWQERIAVLRLCEDRELVRETGFRLDESHFLICS